MSSNSDRFFAVVSNNQSNVSLYRYKDMECIGKYEGLSNAFLGNFSASGKVFMMVYTDAEAEKHDEIQAMRSRR